MVSENVVWQDLLVTRDVRRRALQQEPAVIWFTGLSGAGKTTIASIAERKLLNAGKLTFLLDGDNVRHGLSGDLGFSVEDRNENIRRVAEVARLMNDAGLIVLASFISPLKEERALARQIVEPAKFIEVFVDTPIAVAERRDPKGLYAKARAGLITNFTGINSPYERPDDCEIVLSGSTSCPEQQADAVIERLRALSVI